MRFSANARHAMIPAPAAAKIGARAAFLEKRLPPFKE
jgi:hypothetical protein